MTTTWKIPADWQGETVAVLASGPNMSQDVADSLREHRRIVVNYTHRLAPDADMLVAMDGNWPQEYRDFAGLRVTGIKDDTLDALYIGPRWEPVRLDANTVIEIHNSGLTAVRIAALMGASRIIMAGFDPENPRHWYDDHVDTGGYVGLSQALQAIEAELTARGVIVERYNAPAAPAKAKAKRV
jgi:hypothetical protein